MIIIFTIDSAFAATDFSEMTDEELNDKLEELLSSDSEFEMTMQDVMENLKAGEMDITEFEAIGEELYHESTLLLGEIQGIIEELKTRGYEFEAGVSTTEGLKPMITISKPTLTNDVTSPRMQVKQGIAPSDIICNYGLELVFKNSDNSPACVKPSTAEKLIERGWARV